MKAAVSRSAIGLLLIAIPGCSSLQPALSEEGGRRLDRQVGVTVQAQAGFKDEDRRILQGWLSDFLRFLVWREAKRSSTGWRTPVGRRIMQHG
jgi:hypothetical protein